MLILDEALAQIEIDQKKETLNPAPPKEMPAPRNKTMLMAKVINAKFKIVKANQQSSNSDGKHLMELECNGKNSNSAIKIGIWGSHANNKARNSLEEKLKHKFEPGVSLEIHETTIMICLQLRDQNNKVTVKYKKPNYMFDNKNIKTVLSIDDEKVMFKEAPFDPDSPLVLLHGDPATWATKSDEQLNEVDQQEHLKQQELERLTAAEQLQKTANALW